MHIKMSKVPLKQNFGERGFAVLCSTALKGIQTKSLSFQRNVKGRKQKSRSVFNGNIKVKTKATK